MKPITGYKRKIVSSSLADMYVAGFVIPVIDRGQYVAGSQQEVE